MADPRLVPVHVRPTPRRAAGSALALMLAVGAGLAGATLLEAGPGPTRDACALPGGVALDALPDADRSWIARRAVLCRDREHGRLDAAGYRSSCSPPMAGGGSRSTRRPRRAALPLINARWRSRVPTSRWSRSG